MARAARLRRALLRRAELHAVARPAAQHAYSCTFFLNGKKNMYGTTCIPTSRYIRMVDLEFTGVCIIIFYYTGQSVTSQLRRARPQGLILGFIACLRLGSVR